jgi:hypothetical protein
MLRILMFSSLSSISALMFVSCSPGVMTNSPESSLGSKHEINVSPSGALTKGFGEENKQEFEITLRDWNDIPVEDETVIVSFVGSAHNGTLSPSRFLTNGDGIGTVVFKPPDKEASFEIRFLVPAWDKEVLIPVTIVAGKVGTNLRVNYLGEGSIGEVDVAIDDETECAELTTTDELETISTEAESEFPQSIVFDDVYRNQAYAIRARGWDENGNIVAVGCLDNLVSAGDLSIMMNDLPKNVAGVYDVSVLVDTGGTMDDVVDDYEEYLHSYGPFITDPAKEIIRQIRNTLSGESVEHFDLIDTERDLHSILVEHFEENSINLSRVLAPILEAVKIRADLIAVEGLFNIEDSGQGQYVISHSVTELGYSVSDSFNYLSIDEPEFVLASGRVDVYDTNIFYVEKYHIKLGVGDLIRSLLENELEGQFGVPKISEAFELIVDCSGVVQVLVPLLETVADEVILHAGCVRAVEEAGQFALSGIELLNGAYDRIALDGNLRLEEQDGQVEALTDGFFTVFWNGSAHSLGPMSATFNGNRGQ